MAWLWWVLALAATGVAVVAAVWIPWFWKSRHRGVFVMRQLLPESVREIKAWAREHGIPTIVPELHVTLCFSRAAFPVPSLDQGSVVVRGGKRSLHVFGPGALVLVFESEELQQRHAAFRRLGASFDFPVYHPHVSLTYIGADRFVGIPPFEGDFVFGPETMRRLDPDEGPEIAARQRKTE